MKKGLFLSCFFTSLLLFGMFLIGLVNVYTSYQQYGWTYEVTTIIGEVEKTVTMNLTTTIFADFFIGWIGLVLFICFRRIRYLEMNQLVDFWEEKNDM